MKKIFLLSILGLCFAFPSLGAVYQNNNLIENGDFTSGLDSWTAVECSDFNVIEHDDGNFLSWGYYDENQSISQDISIPSDAGITTLSYEYIYSTVDSGTYDNFSIIVTELDGSPEGVNYLIESRYPSEGNVDDWAEVTYDLSSLRGKNVRVMFVMQNDSDNITWSQLKDIKVEASSYSVLKGTVKNQEGAVIRKAKVVIKDADNNKVWSGKTNKKGKFSATGLSGADKKYKIIITKSGDKKVFKKLIDWGKKYSPTFTL